MVHQCTIKSVVMLCIYIGHVLVDVSISHCSDAWYEYYKNSICINAQHDFTSIKLTLAYFVGKDHFLIR